MENQIFETDHHKIILYVEDQHCLGRSIVLLKRRCSTLEDLTPEEWADFGEIVKKVERALKKSFDSTMFNWGCLLNSGYQQKPYSPQVHWHVRPRYEKEVEFQGITWSDPQFGKLDINAERVFPDNINKAIISEIKKNL